jgi:hypothetical protein
MFEQDQASFITLIVSSAESFVQSQYDLFTLQSMFILGQVAQAQHLVNRAAYIAQLSTWFISVLTEVASLEDQVNAAQSDSDLAAIVFDPTYSAFIATNPLVTISGALAIPN